MQQRVKQPRAVRGTVTAPGNKSISHRAAIFNAIAQGEALVQGFLRCGDCLATLSCLRRLGVPWRWEDKSTLRVEGVRKDGLREPNEILDCGNSGTTLRLLAGILAPQPFFSILTGDASLRSRPMSRIVEPLQKMGAQIWGRGEGGRAPLAIQGSRLRGIDYSMPVASGQVKSALILAGLYADGETNVMEPAPTRDHTERMLKEMGADVRFGESPRITVRPLSAELKALSLRVPGDISSAAPWLVLGSLHPDAEIRIEGVGVNATRTGIIDILMMMGADIRLEAERMWGPEPVADIVVRSATLRGTAIDGDLVPRAIDELPLLALAGCLAEGETVIKDAAELRVKESDRVRTTAEGLRRLGATVEEMPDGLSVRGPQRLNGASVYSHGDHRLAMMLGVAGCLAKGETIVHNSRSVAVSYPWFWDDLEGLSAQRWPIAPVRG